MHNTCLSIFALLLSLSMSECNRHRIAEIPAPATLTDKMTVPAFPGAEGCGKYTTGGRGGKVLTVTNLDDDGPGSLRVALEVDGPRIVVFAVSGTIELKSTLRIRKGDLTIAGQTAPGDGICLRNYSVHIESNNVIIRFLRFRMGDEAKQQDDALSCLRHKNIMIDHCSFSWSIDECASLYDTENLSMQWCIIAESLNRSAHVKGPHGYGGIWGGNHASFHHNLLAHHTSRNPRFCGSRYHHRPEWEVVDFRNNVIFNWGHNSAYGGEQGNYNMVNNYYKSGPATSSKVKNRIVNPSSPLGLYYVTGNHVEGFPKESEDNWSGGVQCEHPDSAFHRQAFPMRVEIPAETAKQAYDAVLDRAGASLHRDAIDSRIVREVRTGATTFGNGIINSQADVGGWPELKSEPAPPDSDYDGMPDAWELTHSLSINKDDAAGYSISKEYTNIEVYLNSIVLGQ
ncbi:MAG: pectate lyase [Saprospiraceae bacterium]